MFLFEQWHLFVTNMELLKLAQVELVVVSVQSVDERIFSLLRYYQLDGVVTLRASLELPSNVESLDFNPNAETMWNNQLVNFHDALYEFRYSADFIAFPDWDEFIVTADSSPLPNVFSQLIQSNPSVAVFYYERSMGVMPSLGQCLCSCYNSK